MVPFHQGRNTMKQKITAGLCIIMGLYFIAIATMGFMGAEPMVKTFDAIGIGQWFRYVTATCQFAGGLMLLLPRLRLFGAALVSCVLSGAIVARIVAMHASPLIAVVLLAVALFLLWQHLPAQRARAAA
jgi:putative oxidoreductase